MNWSDVRVFLEIHRARTLSAAAKSMGVYASTIGRRLDALEREMGVILFQRTPEGLVPTAAADDMVESAEVMERHAQLIAQQLSGKSASLSGEVRLATTAEIASHFLMARLSEFRLRHPDILVTLETSTAFADVTRGEADLALRFTLAGVRPITKAQEQSLVVRHLASIGIGLYATGVYLNQRGRPSTARDLSGHDLIMPSTSWVPGYDWMMKYGENCRRSIRTDTIAGLAAAVVAGHGIAPLPAFMAIGQPGLECLGSPDRILHHDAWLLMPTDLRRVARVRALWEFLVEAFGDWGVID